MIISPFLLLFIGLVLVFFEFYLPGGICGTLGAIAVLASIVFFAMQYQSLLAIVLYTVGAIISLIFLFRFALWRIRHAKPHRSIYSEADQEGYIASEYDRSLIGKVAIAHTDLRPGGKVFIEREKYPAISESGYIPKGSQVIVLDGQGDTLIVKQYKKDKTL